MPASFKSHRLLGLTFLEVIVIMAIIIIALIIISPVTMCETGSRPKVSRVRSDLRSLATCIESYYVDNNAYPVSATGNEGANRALNPKSHVYYVPTFRLKLGPDDPLHTLTTPIAYCTAYFADPCATEKGATFAYHSLPTPDPDKFKEGAWLLWSPGPDGVYDIDYLQDYNPFTQPHPSPSLIHHTYDPTNGAVSSGDIWRAKE